MEKMTAEDIIKKYGCRDGGNGRLMIRNYQKMDKDRMRDEIRSRKAEILKAIRDREAEEEAAAMARIAERRRKEDAIEGLREIRGLKDAWKEYRDAFSRMMENEDNDGLCLPKKPETETGELLRKYPKAAAYLHAEAYSHASHHVKAYAGKRACERILNGEAYEQAIADMEAEWDGHCKSHMWD